MAVSMDTVLPAAVCTNRFLVEYACSNGIPTIFQPAASGIYCVVLNDEAALRSMRPSSRGFSQYAAPNSNAAGTSYAPADVLYSYIFQSPEENVLDSMTEDGTRLEGVRGSEKMNQGPVLAATPYQ